MWLAMVLTSVGAIIQCASFHVWILDTRKAFHLIELTFRDIAGRAVNDRSCYNRDGLVLDSGETLLTRRANL